MKKINEYKDLIIESFPGFIIDSAYDYGDVLVFNLLPEGFEKSDSDESPANSSFSVDKKSKEIKPFFPFSISLDAYMNGKQIL